jgi:hypothetical protein
MVFCKMVVAFSLMDSFLLATLVGARSPRQRPCACAAQRAAVAHAPSLLFALDL